MASDSPSEEGMNGNDNGDDNRWDSMEHSHHPLFGVESASSSLTHGSTDSISPGPTSCLGKSKADSGYNDMFQVAEGADTAALPVPDHNHTAPVHCVTDVLDNVQNFISSISLVPPAHNLTQKATHSSC
jgi:hypothetical protein